jgi:lysophospholipase L1-like esterase
MTHDPNRPHPLPLHRRVLYASLGLTISLAISLVAALTISEVVFRFLEHREISRSSHTGPGGLWLFDPRWGWKPSPGDFIDTTPEFRAAGSINSLFMNDRPYDPRADASRIRLLALGDSHTYAVGVSMEDTWVKVLERRLNSETGRDAIRTYNAGTPGYSVHQYLLRLIDQGPIIRPHYVIVGLSYATDLYDLLPPNHGGWIYGGDRARDYFDFDDSGSLIERHWAPPPTGTTAPDTSTSVTRIRNTLDHLATFRQLRRSKLALFIGSHVRVHGQSLWPNMDVVLEATVSAQHQYQWRVLEALLDRLKLESDHQRATLIIVGIPYLPQVYDDIWQDTFASEPRYSRTAANERVAAFCKRRGIVYVDTTEALRRRSAALGRWVHYRRDGHPTAEGHQAIAAAIVDAHVITLPRVSARIASGSR